MSNAIPAQNLSSGLGAPALLTLILENIVASKHDPVSARTGLIFVTFKSSSFSFVIVQILLNSLRANRNVGRGKTSSATHAIEINLCGHANLQPTGDRYINKCYVVTNEVALYYSTLNASLSCITSRVLKHGHSRSLLGSRSLCNFDVQ